MAIVVLTPFPARALLRSPFKRAKTYVVWDAGFGERRPFGVVVAAVLGGAGRAGVARYVRARLWLEKREAPVVRVPFGASYAAAGLDP